MSTPNDPPQGPYGQQPQGPPGYPAGPYQQPPQQPRRKRHTARTVLLSVAGAVGLLIVLGVAGAALSGGHKPPGKAAAASTVTTAPPTSAAPSSPAPSPHPAWWVLDANKPSDIRVFHGTQSAAGSACNACTTVDGPFTSKPAARQDAAKDAKQVRAQLAAQLREKRRRHRQWLHRTVAYRTDRIVYTVTGTGYPSIQYGTDSNTTDVPGGYGPLGDGSALPFSASQRYDPNALYFAVTAQLEGGGDITATVTEVKATVYKDGHSVTHTTRLARGHAAGGYAIANAEAVSGF